MTTESILNCSGKSLDAFVILEVYCLFCAHSLCKVKTFLLTVYCTDILDTHGLQDRDTDQANRSAALYNNTAVETKDSCGFCSLDSMYQYGTGLDQDTGIQIQITYVEEGGTKAAASD